MDHESQNSSMLRQSGNEFGDILRLYVGPTVYYFSAVPASAAPDGFAHFEDLGSSPDLSCFTLDIFDVF